ncbi:MAG: PilZ domain-containing protein [Sedimentisphaerales bacterium]|nr:PilZ domain-containing protein [Sedimentisphaerales bacterium]
MTRRNFVVGIECKQMLTEAADKQIPIKITQKLNCRWAVFKSAFLATQSNRLVLAEPVPDIEDADVRVQDGQEIAVTFKKGYSKCLFLTRLVDRGEWQTETGQTIPVLKVLWPQQIEKFQRRAFNRATAPPGQPIRVNFWPIESTPGPKGSKWQGTLHDLSAGGMGVIMRKSEMPALQSGEQFEMWFVPLPGQESLCLPVQFRHATPMPEAEEVMLGFQIVGLEISEEGRALIRWIGRIANVYQRQQPLNQHPIKPTIR